MHMSLKFLCYCYFYILECVFLLKSLKLRRKTTDVIDNYSRFHSLLDITSFLKYLMALLLCFFIHEYTMMEEISETIIIYKEVKWWGGWREERDKFPLPLCLIFNSFRDFISSFFLCCVVEPSCFFLFFIQIQIHLENRKRERWVEGLSCTINLFTIKEFSISINFSSLLFLLSIVTW